MLDYETSEQLFIDVWSKYGSPNQIENKQLIRDFLNDLIIQSKHLIVLDHYSHINFDEIIKVDFDESNNIFKLYWIDNEKYRIANLNHDLSEFDALIWYMNGCCTYEYLAVDIRKIKFLVVDRHIFVLIQANMTSEKQMKKSVIGNNEIIEIENCTDELYSRYTFWEGAKEELRKIICIVNNLPYYVCLIQPKENVTNTETSKKILLSHTIKEIDQRLNKVKLSLEDSSLDIDGIREKGNTIRTITEYALKHFCVMFNIKIDIEHKYGHIKLGDLKKAVRDSNINIPQSFVNTANELSHDSGKQFSLSDIITFYDNAKALMDEVNKMITQM